MRFAQAARLIRSLAPSIRQPIDTHFRQCFTCRSLISGFRIFAFRFSPRCPAGRAGHFATRLLRVTCPRAVNQPARLLRTIWPDVVKQISIPKPISNPGRQQHHGKELQSRLDHQRGAAKANIGRCRRRPLLQSIDSRRQFRQRRLEILQFSAGAGGFIFQSLKFLERRTGLSAAPTVDSPSDFSIKNHIQSCRLPTNRLDKKFRS